MSLSQPAGARFTAPASMHVDPLHAHAIAPIGFPHCVTGVPPTPVPNACTVWHVWDPQMESFVRKKCRGSDVHAACVLNTAQVGALGTPQVSIGGMSTPAYQAMA